MFFVDWLTYKLNRIIFDPAENLCRIHFLKRVHLFLFFFQIDFYVKFFFLNYEFMNYSNLLPEKKKYNVA